MDYSTIEAGVGNTPLVRLQRLPGETDNHILVKLEGNNPAGSVKDRPALSMIKRAEERGEIAPGDTLIEATSGNTGIALAMAAAIRDYRMMLIMPENMSLERRAIMKSFGAEIRLVPQAGSMEAAIDLARQMEARGEGRILDQFANPDNPRAHYEGTGPEIWRDTEAAVTHFVSSMGTTGTIMGVGRYLKERDRSIQIVGVQPVEGLAYRASAAGPRPICPRSTIRPVWTASSRSLSGRRRGRRGSWRRGRASFPASPRAARSPRPSPSVPNAAVRSL